MFRVTRIACLAALVLLVCDAGPQAQNPDDPPLKTYTIERASSPITIGKFNKEAWKNAEEAHLGALEDGKPGRYDTTFRMLYDDEKLYIAVHCVDEHVFSPVEPHESKIRDAKSPDDPVYNGDCILLFLMTGSDPHYYYEIDVSPSEAVWDALIVNTRGWDSSGAKDTLNRTPLREYFCEGLEVRVVINGGKLNGTQDGTEKAESWDLEIAIPLTQVPGGKNVPPQPGDEWRGNLFRTDRPPDGKDESQSFSPTLSSKKTRVGRFAHFKFK